jgi:hypothetical protein
VVFAPQGTRLATLVRVAGTRWSIEGGLEAAMGEVGVNQYEVRSRMEWYRHITLAMWALALLTMLRAGMIAVETFKKAEWGLQPRAVWRPSRPAVVWNVCKIPEICRLVWRLPLAVQQTINHILT